MREQIETSRTPLDDVPTVVIIDGDHRSITEVESALLRRFGSDYRILTAGSAASGLRTLKQLARQGTDVALVAADLCLTETGGVDFLEQAHDLHPNAGRALLVAMDKRGTRIPSGAVEAIQRATALGRIDFSVVKGWVSPEEWFYPQVQEALSRWVKSSRPHHEVMRIIGEQWSPRSHELRDILSRNTVPFGFYSADSAKGQELVRDHAVNVDRLPAIILHDGSVLYDPSQAAIANALGVETTLPPELYDLVILGAGPAGLSAAVNAASEGLRTLVIESQSVGGQAGTSSLIRNYLGFPRGVSGGDLTFRAYEQALLFGARFVFTQRAIGLTKHPHGYSIVVESGDQIAARSVIVATGVEYRRLGIPVLERLVGAGVFYGAAGVEASAMAGEHVYVIGGANSAGQAALHLSKFAERVTLLVRGGSLAGMSSYLVTELESNDNIEVLLHTRVVDGCGTHRLEHLVLEDTRTRERTGVAAGALFVLIGTQARTEWLGEKLQRDHRGFVLTGREISARVWPLDRPPLTFETGLPGVFAIGDMRHGSVMRVAGAVGDGSMAVSSVHQYLFATTKQWDKTFTEIV